MSYKILLAAAFTEDGRSLLESAPDVALTCVEETLESVKPYLVEADALIVGDVLIVDESLYEAAPRLKVIGRAGASLTNVDVDAATRRGIIVMNTPGVDAITVAEYTFALMLALVRCVFSAHTDLIHQDWQPEKYIGTELQGKTLGILGFGHVGREVASRAIAFGLDILVYDPYVRESQVLGMRLKMVGLDELLNRSDIITLHTSVVPDTENLINAETLAMMKRGVFLINVKHNSLINADDVLAALESGQLAGVALDDFEPESLTSHPLIGHPRVIHTQRMRFNTQEAQHNLSNLLAPQILDALHEQDYRNAVNLPFIPGREYEALEPHLRLSEHIGLLHHSLGHRTGIVLVEINISGDEMEGMLKPLTVALLKGLLAPRLGKSVNYINAPVLANERGIAVTQSKGLALDSYPNLFTTRVEWDDGGELVVAGAIFNQTEPRIVQVDRYRTDFVPDGTLLFLGSYDVPGVIGRVGTFMAENQINIAGWRTSRVEKGGNTLSVISIDDPLSDGLLNDLRAREFVRHATQITF
jgi:D-3-phosphoglycerate dehydrogenase